MFSVISVSLNNKGTYFSEIILDYHCDFFCKYVSVWFPCLFSVTKILSVIFSVIIHNKQQLINYSPKRSQNIKKKKKMFLGTISPWKD